MWDDLERVTAREGSIHPLFPMRIESLLLVLLADKIKKESLDPRGLLGISEVPLMDTAKTLCRLASEIFYWEDGFTST